MLYSPRDNSELNPKLYINISFNVCKILLELNYTKN